MTTELNANSHLNVERTKKTNPAYITVFKRVRNWQNQAPLEMGRRKLKQRTLFLLTTEAVSPMTVPAPHTRSLPSTPTGLGALGHSLAAYWGKVLKEGFSDSRQVKCWHSHLGVFHH